MGATHQRFPLGQTYATPGALKALTEAVKDASQFLKTRLALRLLRYFIPLSFGRLPHEECTNREQNRPFEAQ